MLSLPVTLSCLPHSLPPPLHVPLYSTLLPRGLPQSPLLALPSPGRPTAFSPTCIGCVRTFTPAKFTSLTSVSFSPPPHLRIDPHIFPYHCPSSVSVLPSPPPCFLSPQSLYHSSLSVPSRAFPNFCLWLPQPQHAFIYPFLCLPCPPQLAALPDLLPCPPVPCPPAPCLFLPASSRVCA